MLKQVAAGMQLSLHQNCLLQDRPGAVLPASPVCYGMAKAAYPPGQGEGTPGSMRLTPQLEKAPCSKALGPAPDTVSLCAQHLRLPWHTVGAQSARGNRSAEGVTWPRWTRSEQVGGLLHMAGTAAASATPPSCSALAGPKAPSPAWKDDRSPGCPAAFPGFAECLGTSGRGQVQGIKLTNGRAVCPGRRGIQALPGGGSS